MLGFFAEIFALLALAALIYLALSPIRLRLERWLARRLKNGNNGKNERPVIDLNSYRNGKENEKEE